MIGRTYLLRGEPVTVRAAFRLPSKANPPAPCPPWLRWLNSEPPAGAPRNVLIQHATGELTVRPFRGLRLRPEVTS